VDLLAKEAELVRVEALASQNAVGEKVGQKAVAEEAYAWLKGPQVSPKKKPRVSPKKMATARLKNSILSTGSHSSRGTL
jgi:hypothetical protein